MYSINVKNITKSYSEKVALSNVDFYAQEGGIHGLLGPNGAGKTTLIRCINRIIVPDSGEILLNDKPIQQDDVFSIGYMPEERGLYKKMKVGEQIVFFAQLKGLKHNDAVIRAKRLLKEFGIDNWWSKKVEDLSKGMAQKIQFINTIIHEPKVLILDEPFSGFDPINANLIKEKILDYKKKGALIILSTHDMGSVQSICDEFTLINNSSRVLSGKVDEVRDQYALGRFYLEFVGQNDEYLSELDRFCSFTNQTKLGDNNTKLSIKLNSEISPRDFITMTNEKVDIYEFSKTLPSMNEIFIRAVGGEIL